MALVAATAAAEVVQVDLAYTELKLGNGKVIRPAVIRTFDPEAGTVSVESRKQITSVPVPWLPEVVRVQLQELAPPPRTPEQLAARQAAARERERREQARLDRAEQQTRTSVEHADKRTAADLAQAEKAAAAITAAATTRANQYFKYEYGKGAGLTFTPEYELEEPEPVPGWTGRHRITGKAYIRRYANQGSFDAFTREFEVLVDVDGKGRAKVVDLTLK
jgi:hypothetical protein